MKLNTEQREELQRVVRSNKNSIRERSRARILLAADVSQCSEDSTNTAKIDQEICQLTRSSPATVGRVRQRFVEEGLDAALYHKEQRIRKARAIDGDGEAHLIATVCSAPPEGCSRWTLKLIKGKLIEGGYVDGISPETIRQTLKKMNLNRG